jgi:hypothetical protein
MASLVPPFSVRVLEPTPGIGNIVSALQPYKFDITAPIDFFMLDKNVKFDCVVMNPPFSSRYALLENAPLSLQKTGMRVGYEILKMCMKKAPCVIALMPWFTLSDSDLRLRFLQQYGIVSLTALPRKSFQYARIQTVIIKLVAGYQGETIFKIFDFPKVRQPELGL